MPTTVEVLAEAFEEAGTPFIVGHPGGESVELIEAAPQRQVRFLLMKQKNLLPASDRIRPNTTGSACKPQHSCEIAICRIGVSGRSSSDATASPALPIADTLASSGLSVICVAVRVSACATR
jgi:hypothetical protein